MKTRTSRISWLRVETGGLLVEGGLANRKQWRAYGRVCVTLRSAWFKAFKRALCATLTNRNYPVTLLSLFLSHFVFPILYSPFAFIRFYARVARMGKKIYPVYLFQRGLLSDAFYQSRRKMNKIKVEPYINIYIIGLLSSRIQSCLGYIL